jgi:hypothetical protein
MIFPRRSLGEVLFYLQNVCEKHEFADAAAAGQARAGPPHRLSTTHAPG